MKRVVVSVIGVVAAVGVGAVLQNRGLLKVGTTASLEALTPTGQRLSPDGQLTLFGARPVDLVVSKDGKRAFVKETSGLTVLELPSGKVLQRLALSGGSSLTGLALTDDGKRLYYSNANRLIHEISVEGEAKLTRSFSVPAPAVGGFSYPCGLAIKGDRLYVASNRANEIHVLSLADGKVLDKISTPPAPFGVTISPDGASLWVTCWGRIPGDGPIADSSGTKVEVDKRGIAIGGELLIIDLASGTRRATNIGRQAGRVRFFGSDVLLTISNGDELLRLTKAGTVAQRWKAPLGAAPSDVTVIGSEVYVSLGGANEIWSLTKDFKPKGVMKGAWYPAALSSHADNLIVASAKGLGSRGLELAAGKFDEKAQTDRAVAPKAASKDAGAGVYQFTGAVSQISTTEAANPVPTARTVPVARKGVKPVPVPVRPGEPSVFKHVVYVLKENRTYDQVFGDMPQGDGDPKLCIYPERITPNHHALAREFVLLDNYYCNGVLSADGHSWSTEGNVTGYFERAFGGWTRSYPYGDDPIAISETGHIWDAVLDKGLTFRNYGEYDYAEPSKKERHNAILADFQSGARKVKFTHKMGIERLKKYSHPECPGWNMEIPDVVRADYFVRDVAQANKTGKFANFSFVYLPQDHTSGLSAGMPTPSAHMADNDLALGRVVEAVSNSKFWKDTVIFVVEDDPQDGFDHVDGHRSVCLVVSPYTRRGAVVSEFYNQTSVLKTIRHILGLPIATRFEDIASPMSKCFTDKPNLKRYVARKNNVPLDALNGKRTGFRSIPLEKPDTANELELNKHHWVAAKGNEPYPYALTGAHGTGLARRGLKIEGGVREDN